jgi:uncharacterized protein YcgI (DUF1989 family)
MNAPIQPDGAMPQFPALSQPGDYVQFRAEIDCYVVLSACPQDVIDINGNRPTSMAIDVLD